jgi:hypothetical protein
MVNAEYRPWSLIRWRGVLSHANLTEAMKERKILACPSQQNRKPDLFLHLEIITRGYSGSAFNAID